MGKVERLCFWTVFGSCYFEVPVTDRIDINTLATIIGNKSYVYRVTLPWCGSC